MSAPVESTVASLRVLLEGILDYAGLFPPASLDMRTSVKNYASYLRHPQRWALGRFVLPVARLDEFRVARKVAREDDAREYDAQKNEAWHLSGIIPEATATDVVSALAAAEAFNRTARGAVIQSLEVRVSRPEDVERVGGHRPPGTAVFFEIATERAAEMLPIIRRAGGGAKLRTGGVAEDAFPKVEAVAEFLAQCAALEVPFKATAGLHHPLRCSLPLTDEAAAKSVPMHGFLNLFTAAAIAWTTRKSGASAPLATLAACLADPERAHWHFAEDALTWSGDPLPVRIEADTLVAVRSKFALSFGSCSFEEPIDELRRLALL